MMPRGQRGMHQQELVELCDRARRVLPNVQGHSALLEGSTSTPSQEELSCGPAHLYRGAGSRVHRGGLEPGHHPHHTLLSSPALARREAVKISKGKTSASEPVSRPVAWEGAGSKVAALCLGLWPWLAEGTQLLLRGVGGHKDVG